MIKTQFNEKLNCEKEFEFPALFKNNKYGSIILFNSKTSGTVLKSGYKTHIVGDYYENWVDCFDKNVWTPLKSGESITLTVE